MTHPDATLDPRTLFRLPWSLNDNVLAWLEPTKRCNLYCQGCYSRNDPKSDKTLARVREDLDVFVANRNVDSISIAGGDPLVYPHIVETVRIIREEYGKKPVINTNGLALTPELVAALKSAGLYGFTFHVDSSQVRPGWKNKSEEELHELRFQLASMVADEGGLSVGFNATVFPHTLSEVPHLVRWAQENIDIVHSMVFILYRTLRTEEFDFYAHGEWVQADADLVYKDMDENPRPLVARDVVDVIRSEDALYRPCAYLGGTKDPQSFKWLLSGRLANRDEVFGYVGPRYEANMCDGCPDITVHEGELVWSCRLDERAQYGCFLHAVPRRGAPSRIASTEGQVEV